MKQIGSVFGLIILLNPANANAEDRLRANGAQNSQGPASSYSRHRLRFLKFYSGSPNAAAVRPVVPSPVIGGKEAFFLGTGDGSAGGWTQP